MQNEIQNLLNQVSIINKKYDEIAAITGANFNIFKIMEMETNEVYTHSKLIAEMLNPKGLHNQGDMFLKLFVQVVNKELSTESEPNYLTDFDAKNTQVFVEKHIGATTENEGGRIDMLIISAEQTICIENKINAGDQNNQLIRYYNNIKNRKNPKILYLNLYGNAPEKSSTQNNENSLEIDTDFKIISYKNTICNWIELCIEKTHSLPIIRETLNQYLQTIKKLTNQNPNNKMSNEIANLILKSKENLEAYNNLISINEEIIKINVQKKLLNNIEEIIKNLNNSNEFKKEKFGFEIDNNFLGRKTHWKKIKITNDKLKMLNLAICFEFCTTNGWNNFIYGFYFTDVKEDPEAERSIDDYKHLESAMKFVNKKSNINHAWLVYKDWDKYKDWENMDTIIKINEHDFKEVLKIKITELYNSIIYYEPNPTMT